MNEAAECPEESNQRFSEILARRVDERLLLALYKPSFLPD
jgi:hypothetical protein